MRAQIEDVDQFSPHDVTVVRLSHGYGISETCAAFMLLFDGVLEQSDRRFRSSHSHPRSLENHARLVAPDLVRRGDKWATEVASRMTK